MKHKGIQKPKLSEMKFHIKALAKVQGKDIMPELKLPRQGKGKGRGKDKGLRKQDEAEFRREAVKWLRGRGAVVKRIENGICGYLGNGIPDLLVFYNNKMFWVELKTGTGVMRPEQKHFKELCDCAGIDHVVARGMEDLKRILHG